MSIIPTNCPSCNSKLEWSSTGIDLYCLSIYCEAQNGRSLTHFFGMLNNLDGFGPKTIETLINNGYDTIPKIYGMDYNDFKMCGFGDKTTMNLGSELELSRTRPLQDYRFIAALGIPDLGIGGAKKLLENYDHTEILFSIDIHDIIGVDGFGYNKGDSISQYLYDNKELLEEIYVIGFNIIHEEIKVVESIFTGKRMTFTGKMAQNRGAMEKFAKSIGAIVTGVNSKSDFLVIGDKAGKNKLDAATKFNVEVISEEKFISISGFTS